MDSRLYGKMIGGQEIRLFTEESIQSALDKALARTTENSASVDIYFPGDNRVRGVAMAKLRTKKGRVWSVAVIGDMKDKKLDGLGARLAYEW